MSTTAPLEPSLDLGFAPVPSGTRLNRKRVRYPHSVTTALTWDGLPARAAGVILQSGSGGLYPGEHVVQRCAVAADARACVTSQASVVVQGVAGRHGPCLETTLEVGAGARLAWFPRLTLLRPDASLTQRVSLRLNPGGAAVVGEGFALPETRRAGRLRSSFDLLRDGDRLDLADRLDVDDGADGPPRPALAGANRAFATIWSFGRPRPAEARTWLADVLDRPHLSWSVGDAPGVPGFVTRLASPSAGTVAATLDLLHCRLGSWLLDPALEGTPT
ncbi:MAG: urease accessory protein UreD [Pseudomonadota bacterium]